MVRKTKSKRIKDFVEPDFDPWYCKLLDALSEYMDSIGERDDTEIKDRDIIIIKALIDFYGFEADDIKDILDDVETRSEQVEKELKKKRKN